jgi:hypothetical protein
MQSAEEHVTNVQLLKINEQSTSDLMSSSTDESDDGSFIFVEGEDYSYEENFESFPWLNPSHPLYFPAMQINTKGSARWDAVDKFSVENWYPHLERHTFESRFVTLNYDDILYLMGNASAAYDSTQLEGIFNATIAEFVSSPYRRVEPTN